MKFKCFNCDKEFDESIDIVKHLKQFHKFKDHSKNFKCFVNKTDQCKNTFLTFNGLQKHVRKCLEKHEALGTMAKTDTVDLSQNCSIFEVPHRIHASIRFSMLS